MALPILHDLQNYQQCTLKSIQTYLLRVVRPDLSKEEDLGSEFKALEKDAERVSKLDGVTQRLEALENAMWIGTESTMYGPYIKLANEVLVQCHTIEKRGTSRQLDLDMLCVCSDPEVIFGTCRSDNIPEAGPSVCSLACYSALWQAST
ncbi:hypothetical protein DAEQUDRAFT_721170 [Daedalea quercina L-15889]|uniref:Uncharacterized protein n=1 Tax=Daedalea quercina L-15889 TaxID=1314783 RepID=A0A165TNT1_9APHY|nr:hypothetical protein DAEQUDRAFT_721170 [Daedalea quercina L-15889]